MDQNAVSTRTWSVGELAGATGLTVRTLHHYDELGLLTPRERTQAGHRRYGRENVERLYRIVALRRLGLGRDQVGTALDSGDADLATIVRRQLEAVDAEIELQRRLRELLSGVLAVLESRSQPDVDDILTAIEVSTMHEKYYSEEKLDWLAQRREQIGDDAIRETEREWGEIFAALRTEMEAGTDPADPRLRPYGERATELVAAFHGGNESVRESLKAMWENEDPEQVSRGMADRELFAYLQRVQQAAGAC